MFVLGVSTETYKNAKKADHGIILG